MKNAKYKKAINNWLEDYFNRTGEEFDAHMERIKANEWGDEEFRKAMADIEKYIGSDNDVVTEFFEGGVATILEIGLAVNSKSKDWEKLYKEALDYMLHPNMKGVMTVLEWHMALDQANEEGEESWFTRYCNALQEVGIMKEVAIARREEQRKKDIRKQYAINAAKLKQSMEVE